MKDIIKFLEDDLQSFIEINESQSLFDCVFDKLQSDNKETYKNVLKYIFNLFQEIRNSSEESELNTLNLHFETVLSDEVITMLAEFIWHYFFENDYAQDKTINENNYLQGIIKDLEERTSRDLILKSSGHMATARDRKEISKQNKKLREDRKRNRKHLRWYKSLKKTASLVPYSLLNLKVSQQCSLAKLFEYNPFYLSINQINEVNSYVVFNTRNFNEVKNAKLNKEPLLRINKNIILFDCENSIGRFSQFNSKGLSDLNDNHGTNFDFFLILSFSKKQSFYSVSTKLNRIKERYFINDLSNYTITQKEFDNLLGEHENDAVKISFIGTNNSIFWEDLFHQTKTHELYELRSIKMMNVYSLCYNEEFKNFILNQIFNENTNGLISNDTKQGILNLPNEDINQLKTLLDNTLENIIQSEIKDCISNTIRKDTFILVDDFILQNDEILNLLKNQLLIKSRRRFIAWDKLEEINSENTLIISYRDQGNYNYHFYPNLNELPKTESIEYNCILPALFFEQTYAWSRYNLAQNYYKILDHSIRRKYFNWSNIGKHIEQLKPEKKVDRNWGLENDYSGSDARVTYKITFENNRTRTSNQSDLYIYFEGGNNEKVHKRIQTIRWIYDNVERGDNDLFFEKLEDVIEEFNPAEKLINDKQQRKDLEIIKNQFDLGEAEAGRLWKILLSRKVDSSSLDEIYNELESLFKKNNLSLVSLNHFECTWVNPDSDTLVPRGNKVFRVLCEYLGLPISYRRIIYTIKNQTISGKRNATRIYSNLLKSLFNDGCFDDDVNIENLLKSNINDYKNEHKLDELSIDEENPLKDLVSLVELIKDEFSHEFNKVEHIEKMEQ